MPGRRMVVVSLLCILTSALMLRAQSPAAKELDDLDKLKNNYLLKRNDALKPVNAWYESQLESLRKKLTQKGDLDGALRVRDEIQSWKNGGSGDPEKEFVEALQSTHWSWAGTPQEKGVEMTFRQIQTVTHKGMSATWKVTGPREVTLEENGQVIRVLRFDQKMTEYKAVDGMICGHRWK